MPSVPPGVKGPFPTGPLTGGPGEGGAVERGICAKATIAVNSRKDRVRMTLECPRTALKSRHDSAATRRECFRSDRRALPCSGRDPRPRAGDSLRMGQPRWPSREIAKLSPLRRTPRGGLPVDAKPFRARGLRIIPASRRAAARDVALWLELQQSESARIRCRDGFAGKLPGTPAEAGA